MRKITKRSAAIIAVTAIAVSGGAAWAANWYLSGTNSASASATTIQAVDVTLTASSQLYPGAKANAVLAAKNPNPYAVKVTGVSGTPVVTVTGGAQNVDRASACTPATAGITLKPTFGSGVTVPGNLTNLTNVDTVSQVIEMASTAPESCAGATFTVSFTTTGSIA
jgi:hypothetical protein